MTPGAGTTAALILDQGAWIDRLFPDADRGRRLRRALEKRFGDDARGVTEEVCREVEAVAHDVSRHFAIQYVASPPTRSPPRRRHRAPSDRDRLAGRRHRTASDGRVAGGAGAARDDRQG